LYSFLVRWVFKILSYFISIDVTPFILMDSALCLLRVEQFGAGSGKWVCSRWFWSDSVCVCVCV